MRLILYICIWIVGGNCPMKVETRTPFPDTFCSGLQKTGTMKTINLSQGQVALVDDDDYNWLNQWKWCAGNYGGKFYAVRHTKGSHHLRKQVFMHRLIMNTPKGKLTDHRNRNGLDNQRHNLRDCNHSQNNMNKTPFGKSKYMGVYYDRHLIKMGIKVNGKYIRKGGFKTEEAAAKYYDNLAKIYHGEFANLNFKDEQISI